jgi:hypothetical protein
MQRQVLVDGRVQAEQEAIDKQLRRCRSLPLGGWHNWRHASARSVAQRLRLGPSQIAAQEQVLGPGQKIDGEHHDGQPGGVDRERSGREVGQAGVLRAADAVLDPGVRGAARRGGRAGRTRCRWRTRCSATCHVPRTRRAARRGAGAHNELRRGPCRIAGQRPGGQDTGDLGPARAVAVPAVGLLDDSSGSGGPDDWSISALRVDATGVFSG